MRVELDFSQNCDCEVRNVEWFDSAVQAGVSFSALNDAEQMASENEASN